MRKFEIDIYRIILDKNTYPPKKRGKKKQNTKQKIHSLTTEIIFFELRFLFYLLKIACYSHIIYPTYSSLSFYWDMTNSQFYLQYIILNTLISLPTAFSIRYIFSYSLGNNRILWENNKVKQNLKKLRHHNRAKFS